MADNELTPAELAIIERQREAIRAAFRRVRAELERREAEEARADETSRKDQGNG